MSENMLNKCQPPNVIAPPKTGEPLSNDLFRTFTTSTANKVPCTFSVKIQKFYSFLFQLK